jgi:peptide deformylase
MAILSVRKYGDPVLRRRADRVRAVTPEIRATLEDMIDTMYHEVGLGLAAPQVGVPLRMMVVEEEGGRGPLALVNPELVAEAGRIVAEEGCLSIPGVFGPVARAEWVRLVAQGLEGQPLELEAQGLLSRVIQHELDHLDGVLFIDRLDPVQRDRVKRQIRKGGLREDAPHRAFAL